MAPISAEGLRISPRLKHALVADLVLEDLSDDGDLWLVDPLDDKWDWTWHLARQLGIHDAHGPGGVHDTLLLIVIALDELVKDWPPRHDLALSRDLAHAATKHLSPIELYATLLAGPERWCHGKVEGCKLERLPSQMQPMLEKGLAAELSRVLAKWVEWDIRKLHDRRKEAIKALEAARTEAETSAAGPRVPFHRRVTARDRSDRLIPQYQPPGRT